MFCQTILLTKLAYPESGRAHMDIRVLYGLISLSDDEEKKEKVLWLMRL